MGIDAAAATHLVGIDQDGIFYRTDASGSWSTVRLSADRAGDHGIAAAFDASGHAWVVWFSSAGLSLLTDAAGGPNHGWPASPQLLVAGNGYWPSIAVRDGHVYIAYLGHNGHLHSLSDVSGAWLDVVVVDHAVHETSIAVDSTGRARIAFTDSSDRPVTGIEVAQDHGTATHPSFVITHVPGSSAPQLDWTDPTDGSPRIAIDRHDRTHLAWEHVTHAKDIPMSHVYVASLGNGHWTPPSKRLLGSGSPSRARARRGRTRRDRHPGHQPRPPDRGRWSPNRSLPTRASVVSGRCGGTRAFRQGRGRVQRPGAPSSVPLPDAPAVGRFRRHDASPPARGAQPDSVSRGSDAAAAGRGLRRGLRCMASARPGQPRKTTTLGSGGGSLPGGARAMLPCSTMSQTSLLS